MTSSTHNAPPAVAHADLLDFGGSAPPPATAASEPAAGGFTGDLLGDLLGSETGSGVASPPPAMPYEAAFAGEDQSNLLGDFLGSDAPSTTAAAAGHDDSFLLNFGDDDRPAPAAPSWQPSTGGLDDIFGSVEPSQSYEPPSSSSGGYDMSDMGFAMPTAPPPAAEKPANSLNQGVRPLCRKGERQGQCTSHSI
jgi:hypothetical protein